MLRQSHNDASTHLGTIMEIPTTRRRTLPVKFLLSQTDMENFNTNFFNYRAPLSVFADLFFDSDDLFQLTKPTLSRGKLLEHTLNVVSILKSDDGILVFNAAVNGYNCVLKCANPLVYNQYNRDRVMNNKFKTMMQREVEGFQIINNCVGIDSVKMTAHGNMWVCDKEYTLLSGLEVIVMDVVGGQSLLRLIYLQGKARIDDVYISIADIFRKLFILHSKNIVHGDPSPANIMREGNKMTWIDFERLSKRKSDFTTITWNTLKLIDFNVLLFQSINLILSINQNRKDTRYLNFRQIKENLLRLGVAQECIILPHIIYWKAGIIHDNSSCTALNFIFRRYVDLEFLKDTAMSGKLVLIDLANPQKLKPILERCIAALEGVGKDDYAFPVNEYNDYATPQAYASDKASVITNTTNMTPVAKPKSIARQSVQKQKTTTQTQRTTSNPEPNHANPTDLTKIVTGQSYKLILLDKQMYSHDGHILYYFKDDNLIFSVMKYVNREWINDDFNQLYRMKEGVLKPIILYNHQPSFYSIKNNYLHVVYAVSYDPVKVDIWSSYDMTYNPPRRLEQKINKLADIPEQDEDSLKDLVIDGEQYYSAEGEKYQISHRDGKYILCKGPSREGGNLTLLSPSLLHDIFVYNRDNNQLEHISDESKNFFQVIEHGYQQMILVAKGLLEIYVKLPRGTKYKYAYDITKNPAEYVV